MDRFVSIIIPLFNREGLVSETLDSISKQKYSNWECIIVDDGSTDDSVKVVSEYILTNSRFILYKRPTSYLKGANSCRNFGLEQSKGEFVHFLDSDDILHENFLSEVVSVFSDEKIDAVIVSSRFFDGSSLNLLGQWRNVSPNGLEYFDLLEGFLADTTGWPISAPVWRRKSLVSSPFDAFLYSSQDWLFHVQVLLSEPNLVFLEKELLYIRRDGERIGNVKSFEKLMSTFCSRRKVLKEINIRFRNVERDTFFLPLLRSHFSVIRTALEEREFLFFVRVLLSVLQDFPIRVSFVPLCRLIFLGLPLSLVLGRGYSFFKI